MSVTEVCLCPRQKDFRYS